MASMVEYLANVAGVMRSFFQIGGPTGNGVNNNGTALEAKNATNTAFVVMRGATPLTTNDLVTKNYSDTQSSPFPVGLQFNGANPLPNNSATLQYYVVTTSGPNATIGQLLYDNGTGIGVVEVFDGGIFSTGTTIVTTAALTGGAITFAAFQVYVWNGTAAVWVNVNSSATPGAVQTIQFAVGTATASSVTSLPSNALVLRVTLNVTTPYNVGTTISIGQAGSVSSFQAVGDNAPSSTNAFDAPQVTSSSLTPAVVLATVTGATVGASTVTVEYCAVPNP